MYSSKWDISVLYYLIYVIYQIANCSPIPPSTSYNRISPNLISSLSWFSPVPARGLYAIRPRAVPVLTWHGQMRLLHLPSPVSTLVRQIFKSPDLASPEIRITACFLRCSLQGKMCDFSPLQSAANFAPLSPVRKR